MIGTFVCSHAPIRFGRADSQEHQIQILQICDDASDVAKATPSPPRCSPRTQREKEGKRKDPTTEYKENEPGRAVVVHRYATALQS